MSCHTQVERNQACISVCKSDYPDSCIFPDILDMVDPSGMEGQDWVPNKLKILKSAWCARHETEWLVYIFVFITQVSKRSAHICSCSLPRLA